MVKWTEEYQKLNPKVKIEVSAGGAGKGMTDARSGLVDTKGMVSRDIAPEEIAKGAFYVVVTKEAVVAIINANNPVIKDNLSMVPQKLKQRSRHASEGVGTLVAPDGKLHL